MADIYILGIESSCDDTSAAVLKNGVLLSNVTASQAVHEAYGGVVPELASRAHQQNVVPVVDQAIKRAGITKEQLSAVAFTRGPGLMGSLLVGVSFVAAVPQQLVHRKGVGLVPVIAPGGGRAHHHRPATADRAEVVVHGGVVIELLFPLLVPFPHSGDGGLCVAALRGEIANGFDRVGVPAHSP